MGSARTQRVGDLDGKSWRTKLTQLTLTVFSKNKELAQCTECFCERIGPKVGAQHTHKPDMP